LSKVVCLGITVVDVIAKSVDIIPDKGKLSLVDKIQLHTGGCAVNAAIDLAKLGEEVAVVGLVGRDGFGEFLINSLKAHGVNTDGIKTTYQTSTSTSVVLSNSDGERSFIHCLGANGIMTLEDIDFKEIEKCEVLFVAGALLMPPLDGEPTAEILRRAKEMNKYTILDTAWDSTGRWMKAITPCLPYLDLFIPSIEEAQMLSGIEDEKEIAKIFLELGAKNVVIKLGDKGCYIKNKTEEHYVKGYEVEVVDTNGAGDSFVAGFITGLVNGWDLKKCGNFANAVGAHCVMAVGASNGIKSKDEILNFINKPYKMKICGGNFNEIRRN